ncbi:MAG: hypothetical protein ACO22Y_00160 [Sediminibacterium sp.]
MAITLRSVKGSALTHLEVDNNFRSFIYSSSVNGNTLSLFTTASVQQVNLGGIGGTATNNQVVYRSGSVNTGSDNLQFRYAENKFKINANTEVTGSLIVKGTLQAEQIHTTFTSSSIVFQSGSTNFGNSSDDLHRITGSVQILGDTYHRGETDFINQTPGGNAINVRNGYVILSHVSQSLNYANDNAAALGGVPLGGLYRNGNFIQIRIS